MKNYMIYRKLWFNSSALSWSASEWLEQQPQWNHPGDTKPQNCMKIAQNSVGMDENSAELT